VKRVLLDHCVPRRIATALPDCEVLTTFRKGWSQLNNGDLLRAAEADRFDVFITADKNIRHQQSLAGRRIAIIVLPTNTLSLLLPLFSALLGAVSRAKHGGYEELS
jgi:predicted nuclease of predicted toxin-antitoxin system